MAQNSPRVIRAYSLPVAQFDHLKAYQRSLQLVADETAGTPAAEGDDHWIDNSMALARIVQEHGLLSMAAARVGMRTEQFVAALYMGDLKVMPA